MLSCFFIGRSVASDSMKHILGLFIVSCNAYKEFKKVSAVVDNVQTYLCADAFPRQKQEAMAKSSYVVERMVPE